MAYLVFEGAITATSMSTATQQTGGVAPGVVCYIHSDTTPGVWLLLSTDTTEGTACGVVQDGSGYYGSAVVPSVYVNSGWTIRIILFWMEP